MRKHMGKCYLSKKSFTYEINAGTSKAAHKVFQQKGGPSRKARLRDRAFSGS